MARLVNRLFLILGILLSIQTLIAQFITVQLGLPEWINLWKEVLVLILIIYFLGETIRIEKSRNLKILAKQYWLFGILILAHFFIIVTSLIINQTPLKVFVIGYRFELWWLTFFVSAWTWIRARKGATSRDEFLENIHAVLTTSMIIGFGLVAILSLASLFFGQAQVLQIFGFGKAASGLITPAPLCNQIDFGQNACRLTGSFSTPNHFAGYLLLILPIFINQLLGLTRQYKSHFSNIADLKSEILRPGSQVARILYSHGGLLVLAIIFIGLSFARFSWLGLIAFAGVGLVLVLARQRLIKPTVLQLLSFFSLSIPLFIGLVAININPQVASKYLPSFLVKPSSTIEHYRHTQASLELLRVNPSNIVTGFGLGRSGSAAKAEYQNLEENPLVKDHYRIALKWMLHPTRLPIPENWFLQVLINGGLMYAFLYLIIVLYPILSLRFLFSKDFYHDNNQQDQTRQIITALAFYSIIIGNLFLHIFENQTIALYWTLLWIWSESGKMESG